MKKTFLVLALLSLPAFAHQGHHHGPHTQAAKEKEASDSLQAAYGEIQQDYQMAIKPMFDQKCAACHSLDAPSPWYGKIPVVGWIVESDRREAKEHLEISKGFPFAGHGTPEEDLEALADVAAKDTMPTFLYRALHPASQLSGADKAALLSWVNASRQKIARAKQ